MNKIPVVDILGIKVSVIDRPLLLSEIDRLAAADQVAFVNNVNVHACNLAYEQPAFRDILNSSEVVFCDGFGVKLGATILGQKLGPRMTPPDWIDDLFTLCVDKGYSVYFLGDESTVVELFVDVVRGKFPELMIAGYHDGFFDLQSAENDRVVEAIAASGADIVLTGMGMPRQEFWAWQAKDRLDKGVIIAAGALFRWHTGHEKRAPRWMTDHGLEGVSRLVASPKRHFNRYAVGVPLFLLRILKQRFSKGTTGDE